MKHTLAAFAFLAMLASFGLAHSVSAQTVTPTLEQIETSARPGDPIYLRGTNFNANSQVLLTNGQYAPAENVIIAPSSYTATTLTLTLPSTVALGFHSMQVKQSDSGATSNAASLAVWNASNVPPPNATVGVLIPSTPITLNTFYKVNNTGVSAQDAIYINDASFPNNFTLKNQVIVRGANFGAQASALIDGVKTSATAAATEAGAWNVDVAGPAYLIADFPTGVSAGAHTIQVRQRNGYLTSPVSFTVVADPTPIVTSVSPTSAHVGDTITVTGQNFASNSVPSVNNGYSEVLGSNVAVVSNTKLTFTLPQIYPLAGRVVTPYDLSVASVGIDGVYRYGKLAAAITPLDLVAPSGASTSGISGTSGSAATITSISQGPVATGDLVTVKGSGFLPTSQVCFGSPMAPCQPSTNYIARSPIKETLTATSLQFLVPDYGVSWTGSFDISIMNGSTPSTNSASLTVVAVNPRAPTITSIKNSVPIPDDMYTPYGKRYISAKLGDSILLAGTNFTAASVVAIDGQSVSTTVISPTAISFVVPANTWQGINAVQVWQTDTGFRSVPTLDARFSTVPPIVLTAVSPSAAKPGDTITLSGKNFTNAYWAIIDPDQPTRSMAGIPAGCDMKRSACSLISTDGGHTLTFVLAQSLGSGAALPAGTHTLQIGQTDRGYYSNPVMFTVASQGTASAPTTVPAAPATPSAQISDTGTLSSATGAFTTSPTLSASSGSQSLADQIRVLQAQLQALLAQQGGGTLSTPSMSSPSGSETGAPVVACASITNNLTYRSRGDDVFTLQDFLQSKGYLAANPTGFFGAATLGAVKKFQSDNGVNATGYVGAMTKAKIRSLSCQ